MSLWMIRGDKFGQYHSLALEEGFAYHASSVADLSKATSRDAVLELQRSKHPDGKDAQLRNWAAQLYAFAHRIKEGDLVVMPLRSSPQIAIGRVTGPYKYRNDLGDVHHTRPVEWLRDDIPRTAFGQDLLYSLGAFMTVCQIQRNNAEVRVLEILKGNKDPGFLDGKEDALGGAENGGEAPTDVEQLARDQILAHLEQNFKGHNLARLVDAVLRAEGHTTRLSPSGPDGGVDILAGRGLLGFETPKLCVQVKSSASPADVTVFRGLQGSMATFKADQGLLVSWGGFNKVVEKEAGLSFFSVRLWDANDLVEAVLRNYDRLPEELQNEVPLKQIWALVIEEQ